jgi:hypothetical protein
MSPSRSRPKGLAKRVGFRWPTPKRAFPALTSSPRASSPRLEQGGRREILIQGICFHASCISAFTPQSASACRRLATPRGYANPTTPASAGLRPVPSVPSADAAGSHVPAAPTHPLARRRWSAYADDSGRSAFPLEPPSFAPEGAAATRPAISRKDATVAFRSLRLSQAALRARRGL